MLSAIARMLGFAQPRPIGPAKLLRTAGAKDLPPISHAAKWQGEELLATAESPNTLRVWELAIETKDASRFECRFDLRSADLAGDVYPEMWCRVSGMGEAFSKGLQYRLTGDNDWISCVLPFYLKPGEFIENVRFQLVFSAAGSAAIRDVEFFETPLEF